MGLTQVSTDGVKNDAITKTKIPANQIEASELADNAVDNAAVASNAAIAGTKISPDFGSQNVVSTGTSNALGTTTIKGGSNAAARLLLENTTAVRTNYIGLSGDDDRIVIAADDANQGSNSTIDFKVDGTERMRLDSSGRLLLGKTSGSFMLEVGAGSTDTFRLTNTLETGHGSHDAKIVAGGSYYQNPTVVGSTIKFRTYNGSSEGERMRILSNGRVHIKPTNTNYTMNSNSTNLIIGDGGGAVGMTFLTAGAATGQFISFQQNETLSRAEGEIQYGTTSTATAADRNTLMFRVNSSEKLRIQSGGGISFNGDTAAANALNDYEEGSWTPTVSYGSGGYQSANNVVCTYTKVGNLIHVSGRFSLTQSGSGDLAIGGLPFAKGNPSGDGNSAGIQIYVEGAASNIANDIAGLVLDASTAFLIRRSGSTSSGGDMAGLVDSGTTLLIGGCYQAA